MPDPRPLLIAGGGIGGLATALALARRGFPVQVLERAPGFSEIGAGLQLSPNAVRVLDRLGLGERLRAIGDAPGALRLHDLAGGRAIAAMPLGPAAAARWGEAYLTLHRADLHALLAEAARAAGVVVTSGAVVSGVELGDDSAAVQIAGRAMPILGRALIGADGIESTVRATLGDDAAARVKTVAWRALLPAEALPGPLCGGDIVAWLGASGHVVAYPLRGGRLVNIVAAAAATGAGTPDDHRRRELDALLDGAVAPLRAALGAAEGWARWPLAERPPARAGHGPATLVGDAAHPLLPHLAQGAAMAIEDGFVLALRLAARPDDPATAFRRYEQARAARIARVAAEAARAGRLFALPRPAADARDATLRLLRPAQLMARYDWLYGWGRVGA
jgi:salicylate hydroxylase